MTRNRREGRLAALLALALPFALLAGCRSEQAAAPAGGETAPPPPAGDAAPAGGGGGVYGSGQAAPGESRVRLTDASGALLFTLVPSDKGFRVEGANGAKLGTVKVEGDRVKLADAEGRPLLKVKAKGDGFKLYREPEKAGGEDVLRADFKLSGGGFKVKDDQDRVVYEGDLRANPARVSGPEGAQLVVKQTERGMQVDDASGARLLEAEGLQLVAAAAFCSDRNTTLEEKAAVAAYSARVKP